ncbi:hypothetical protein PAUR_a1156 [Pseudoalteromonas aurantia 208]|uniref:Uncharacterized protein n=1 Tax=Pseudoalteromonas aurantia 208 TaxID=1314867 RepID=A0ABR9E9S7_9GAMM|nr:hypothetical protein [Pseudoalteromonas aurantia 208]
MSTLEGRISGYLAVSKITTPDSLSGAFIKTIHDNNRI